MSDHEKKLLGQLRELNRKLANEQEKKMKKKKHVPPSKQRLLIVTVKLPVDLERCGADAAGDAVWKVQVDSSYEGGVEPRCIPFGGSFFALTGEAHEFSGMRSLAPDYNIHFIGAPTVRDSSGELCDAISLSTRGEQEELRLHLSNMAAMDGSKCIPVFTTTEETSNDEGYVAEVLHPLFHYIPMLNSVASIAAGDDRWAAYVRQNEAYAATAIQAYKDGMTLAEKEGKVEHPLVWIQDYQLLLVPQLMRKALPDIRIGLVITCCILMTFQIISTSSFFGPK